MRHVLTFSNTTRSAEGEQPKKKTENFQSDIFHVLGAISVRANCLKRFIFMSVVVVVVVLKLAMPHS